MNVLLLHPGAMGASIGAALVGNGHRVAWVGEGRSADTRRRAEDAGLVDAGSLPAAVPEAELVLSVCPPDQALNVARQVREAGFAGLYADANAVAPTTAAAVAALYPGRYVDGGIIGPPAWRPGATRFYLSGAAARQTATLFRGSLVDAIAINGGETAASSLKMCYAAYTKGSSALILAVRALAEAQGVTGQLLSEWSISQPDLEQRSIGAARSTAPKAWRFEGEMLEIARTFEQAELPNGFHAAAAALFGRMAGLRNAAGAGLDDVLRTIL